MESTQANYNARPLDGKGGSGSAVHVDVTSETNYTQPCSVMSQCGNIIAFLRHEIH